MVATRNLPGVRLLVRRWRPVPKPNHNPLAVAIERENASAILHLQGQLTVEQAGVLRRAFEEACRSEPVRLVVNLAACPFVDTAGVAALVAEAQRARQARRAFLLVGVRA
ncbi:MAG: STAS domain-containing protein, partial [Terriglobia bacterium]